MIVLDTDIVTLLFYKGTPLSNALLSKTESLEERGIVVVTTVVSYEEQMRGWMRVVSEARSMTDLIKAYGRLSAHIENYRKLPTIRFEERAAVEFQRFRAAKIKSGTLDLRIAAIAVANNAELWSRNLLDFAKVPGLKVSDPTNGL